MNWIATYHAECGCEIVKCSDHLSHGPQGPQGPLRHGPGWYVLVAPHPTCKHTHDLGPFRTAARAKQAHDFVPRA